MTFMMMALFTNSILAKGAQDTVSSAGMLEGRIVIKYKDAVITADTEPGQLLTLLGSQAQKRGLIWLEKRRSKRTLVARRSRSADRMDRVVYGHLSEAAKIDVVLAWLRRHPLVEYAEPLYEHHLDGIPNDPLFAQQSYLQVMQLPGAWDMVKGYQGGAVIAVVDGGTDIAHQDLRQNLWVNSNEIDGNAIDDDGNGYIDDIHGWNFADQNGDPTGFPSQPDFGNHGTHTAGIANAVTNNATGVAGAAWNARLMAINAADRFGEGILYGYDGIIYAAENGAAVINCSWGRSGRASAYEEDVIEYATSLGAVIVASAGNSGSTTLNYPACYPKVFAVAATNNQDLKTSFSTYGDWVDVSAPGMGIVSTIANDGYTWYNGTSMSAPLAAGVIALVKTSHPGWSGFQCAQQVRATADPIDDLNTVYAGLLGMGRVNARQAVQAVTPAIRLDTVDFSSDDGDAQFRPGEHARIYLTVTNYLAPSMPITLSLSHNSTYVTLLNDQVTLPGLATLESMQQTAPFEIEISAQAPARHVVQFKVGITAGEYTDSDRFSFTVSPYFIDLAANHIQTSVTQVGRFGFALPSAATGGHGFTYQNGPNLIYEGSIIAGTSTAQISNAARSATSTPDQDFAMVAEAPLTLLQPGLTADEESVITLQDSDADAPMNLAVRQHTFASATTGYEDFIIFRYELTNNSTQKLANVHFGLFMDWDIGTEESDVNIADFDASRNLGYVYNAQGTPVTHAGCALLSAGSISYRAILNDELASGNPGWGIYDGFSDAEKWDALSGGLAITRADGGDVSMVLSSGPHEIGPDSTITIDFALLAGESLTQLQSHADKAREFHNGALPGEADTALLHLQAGWNLVSSWIAPDDSLLPRLLAPIADELVILKDQFGKSYIPSSGSAEITHWDWKKGYRIYLTGPADLKLSGRRMPNSTLFCPLEAGWNLISYPSGQSKAIEEVLRSISDALLLAKNGEGSLFWPAYGLNTIGDMKPGSGYYLFMKDPTTLYWPLHMLQ